MVGVKDALAVTDLCATLQPTGPTRVGELLLVDVRVARLVDPSSRLWRICSGLGAQGACGVVEATLVVDLLAADQGDREYLLDFGNWPRP